MLVERESDHASALLNTKPSSQRLFCTSQEMSWAPLIDLSPLILLWKSLSQIYPNEKVCMPHHCRCTKSKVSFMTALEPLLQIMGMMQRAFNQYISNRNALGYAFICDSCFAVSCDWLTLYFLKRCRSQNFFDYFQSLTNVLASCCWSRMCVRYSTVVVRPWKQQLHLPWLGLLLWFEQNKPASHVSWGSEQVGHVTTVVNPMDIWPSFCSCHTSLFLQS